MHRQYFKILIVLVAVLFSGSCLVLDKPITLKTGSRSGRVIDAVSGEPIEGAVVVCIWNLATGIGDINERFATFYETTTDRKGKYFIPSQSVQSAAGDWAPRLEPEEVTVYKYGYVVYRVRNNEVIPIMIYLPNLRQKYRRNNNLVKLQPWIEELSHWENVDNAIYIPSFVEVNMPLLQTALAEERYLAERERPQHKPMGIRAVKELFTRERNAYKNKQITREEYISRLHKHIQSPDQTIRNAASRTLIELNETSGIPVLIEKAKKRLYSEAFYEAFYILCTQVGMANLYEYGRRPVTIPERKKALAEIEDWWEKMKDKSRFEWFCDLAVNSKNQSVRRNAVKILGEIGDKAATPYLIQFLNEKKSRISVHSDALRALVEIGDKSAIPSIKKRLTSKSLFARRDAARALHKLGDDSGVPVMIKMLKSSDKHDRDVANDVLMKITDQDFSEAWSLSYFSRKKQKEIIRKWLEWWEENKHRYEEQ